MGELRRRRGRAGGQTAGWPHEERAHSLEAAGGGHWPRCLPRRTPGPLPGPGRAAIQAPAGASAQAAPPSSGRPALSKELHHRGGIGAPAPCCLWAAADHGTPTTGRGPWRSRTTEAHRGQSGLTSSFPLAMARDSGEWPLHSRLVLAPWERSSWTTSRAYWEGQAG